MTASAAARSAMTAFMSNLSDGRRIVFQGQSLTMSQWSRQTGISKSLIHQRLYRLGWSVERTLTQPVRITNRPPGVGKNSA